MENKLLDKFLIPFIAILSLIYAIQALGKEEENVLSNIKHYVAQNQKNYCLEAGNFTFYFVKKPMIKFSKVDQNDTHEEKVFFFPNVVLEGREVKSAIEQMSKGYDHYSIHALLTEKPLRGMQIIIRYDKRKIVLAYEEFESIDLRNGVIFTLYNKNLIQKLHAKKNKSVLVVASNITKSYPMQYQYISKNKLQNRLNERNILTCS